VSPQAVDRPKLTDDCLKRLCCPEGRKDALVFDAMEPGFEVRLTADGKRIFIFQYRIGSTVRRHRIGVWGKVGTRRPRPVREPSGSVDWFTLDATPWRSVGPLKQNWPPRSKPSPSVSWSMVGRRRGLPTGVPAMSMTRPSACGPTSLTGLIVQRLPSLRQMRSNDWTELNTIGA
jgi:hypothetical protein